MVDVLAEDDPVTISEIGAESQESTGAMDIAVDLPVFESTTTSKYFQQPMALEPDTDMDLSASSTSTDPTATSSVEETTDVLRIRGGASNEMELDDESDEDGQDEDEVELGCLVAMPDDREDWNVDLAVGKVGGKPSWIDPSSPLTYADVTCGSCGGYLSFLLQVSTLSRSELFCD